MRADHNKTDWEGVETWYDSLVGKEGHYYHKHVILPKLLSLLDLTAQSTLLDLACGQGILARQIPKEVFYHGIDLSVSLIQQACRGKLRTQKFTTADICKELPLKGSLFSHVTIILALQNVAYPEKALKNAAKHLRPGGTLAIVLNHPCFRIPRHTHWGIDAEKKLQYRRIDRYLSPLKIPILTHPGKGKKSPTTWSFHRPLSEYSRYLADAGFSILQIEEWTSDKKSTGKAARMENRARSEFPLFLTFKCQKITE